MNLKINTDVLLKRSLTQKVLILVGINIVIALAGYFLLISPTLDEVTELTKTLSELTVKIEENRTIASDIARYKREKAALEKRFRKALSKLPNEREIPDLLDSISNAVKDVGLEVFLFKPEKIRKRGFYAEVPVTMTVKGGYESLYEFSDRMAKLPRIVNIEGLNIKNTRRGYSPKLETKLVVMTFMFIAQDKTKGKKGRR